MFPWALRQACVDPVGSVSSGTYPRFNDFFFLFSDLLCRHITRICEQFFKTGNLSIAEKVPFSYYLNAFGKPIQYDISADVLLCSAIPLSPMTPSPMSSTLPDLHPLHCTVSLKRHHFYQAQHHYRKFLGT